MRVVAERALNRLRFAVLYPGRRLRLLGARKLQGVTGSKVFCIGRNKTGTTSLQTFFSTAGFRVAPQWQGERLIHQSSFSPDDNFWRWIDRYEVFQDAPFSWTWFLPLLISRYPDALYILSTRDEEEWLESLINHHYEHLKLPRNASNKELIAKMQTDSYIAVGYMYEAHVKQYGEPTEEPMYGREKLLTAFRQHNSTARALLPETQLLEINIAGSASSSPICEFLGLPSNFSGRMPRENVRRGD